MSLLHPDPNHPRDQRAGVAVIGVGSAHGFDRLGWEVIDELRRRAEQDPSSVAGSVDFVRNQRLGAPLLEQLSDRRTAIIVDAIDTGAPAGTLVRLPINDWLCVKVEVSSHSFGLAQTLVLGRALESLPDELVVMGIQMPESIETAPPPGEVRRMASAVIGELSVPLASL